MQGNRNSHTRRPLPYAGQMDNYTGAFLVSFGVLVFVALFAVWAKFGMPFTLVLAWLTDRFLLRPFS